MEIVTLISVVVNALAAVAAPFLAKRMSKQQTRLVQVQDSLDLVANGLQVIERAVEDNKDALSRSGAGDKIAQCIRTYGSAAKELVDTARLVAKDLQNADGEAAN